MSWRLEEKNDFEMKIELGLWVCFGDLRIWAVLLTRCIVRSLVRLRIEELELLIGQGCCEGLSHGLVWGCEVCLRWSLSVLLIEGDDSSKQSIAALLRKCNYKGGLMGNLIHEDTFPTDRKAIGQNEHINHVNLMGDCHGFGSIT